MKPKKTEEDIIYDKKAKGFKLLRKLGEFLRSNKQESDDNNNKPSIIIETIRSSNSGDTNAEEKENNNTTSNNNIVLKGQSRSHFPTIRISNLSSQMEQQKQQ